MEINKTISIVALFDIHKRNFCCCVAFGKTLESVLFVRVKGVQNNTRLQNGFKISWTFHYNAILVV